MSERKSESVPVRQRARNEHMRRLRVVPPGAALQCRVVTRAPPPGLAAYFEERAKQLVAFVLEHRRAPRTGHGFEGDLAHWFESWQAVLPHGLTAPQHLLAIELGIIIRGLQRPDRGADCFGEGAAEQLRRLTRRCNADGS